MNQIVRSGKMTSKLALMLSLIILTTCFQMTCNMPFAAAQTFSDVGGREWFYPHLGVMLENDIINGFPDGSFRPGSTVNADQFIKMVVVATDTRINETSYAYWAQGYINAAELNGFLNGTQLTDADMKKPISRSHMAIILSNILTKLESASIPSKYLLVTSYIKDYPKYVQTAAQYAIPAAYSTGLLSGYPDGTFGGDRNMTRAEAIAVIHRLISKDQRILSADLAQFLAEEEVVVDGIPFSYEEDVSDYGMNRDMLSSGVVPFFMQSLENMRFYKDASGKLHASGRLPALPAGYQWLYSINIWHNDPFKHEYGGAQTISTVDSPLNLELPQEGNFDLVLAVPSTDLIERVMIDGRIQNAAMRTAATVCLFDSKAALHLSYWDGQDHDEYPLVNKLFDWEGMFQW